MPTPVTMTVLSVGIEAPQVHLFPKPLQMFRDFDCIDSELHYYTCFFSTQNFNIKDKPLVLRRYYHFIQLPTWSGSMYRDGV